MENIIYSTTIVLCGTLRAQMMEKGLFIVVDGLDAIGKGEIEKALLAFERESGRSVYDSIAYSNAANELPELDDFWNETMPYNTIFTCEPTRVGIGRTLREEVIGCNDREYSFRTEIEFYSQDRLVQMKRVTIPARKHGVRVIQSRCYAATVNYQAVKALDEGINIPGVRAEILAHEGNMLQQEWRPDLLIIPTINDLDELARRLAVRECKGTADKKENLELQKRLKPLYESDWLREHFEGLGTVVKYLDAGISIEETQRQVVEIYRAFLESQT